MTQVWITHENPWRKLIVKGRSAIDPDCLVAHIEGDERPLWIVDGGGPDPRTKDCFVTGIDARASRAANERLRHALEEIKRATIEGRVCDDVAWFDDITTLHDYCDQVLRPST